MAASESPADESPRSLADKINHLFDIVRRPDGRPYSNEDVAETMGPVSRSYLYLLRSGERTNPTLKHLEALAAFFGVSPAYFLDEDRSVEIADDLARLRDLADSGITPVAARLGGLSPASLRHIAEVIERFRASEGLDANWGDTGRDDG